MNDKIAGIMGICLGLSICSTRFSIAVGNIFQSLAILIFFYLLYTRRNVISVERELISYISIIALMISCMIPSIIFSYNPGESIRSFAEMWLYRVIPFVMIVTFLKEKKLSEQILIMILLVLSAEGVAAVIQVLTGISNRGIGFHGVMYFAGILASWIPVACVLAADNGVNKTLRTVSRIAVPCLLAGAIAGQSRGLWLTLLCVLPVVLYKHILNNKKYIAVCCAVLLIVVGVFATSPELVHRVKSITNMTTDRSNGDRLVVWESSWNMIKDHPLTGVGLGQFKNVYEPRYRLKAMTQNLNHTHNNFVQVATEAGIFGFLGFFVFTVCVLWNSYAEWLRTGNPYALALFACWAGFSAFGMIDNTLDGSAVVKSMWFLTGVFLVLKKSWNKEFQEH